MLCSICSKRIECAVFVDMYLTVFFVVARAKCWPLSWSPARCFSVHSLHRFTLFRLLHLDRIVFKLLRSVPPRLASYHRTPGALRALAACLFIYLQHFRISISNNPFDFAFIPLSCYSNCCTAQLAVQVRWEFIICLRYSLLLLLFLFFFFFFLVPPCRATSLFVDLSVFASSSVCCH